MTVEQFLAWEERQELRYEFDGFKPIARTGVTITHSGIQTNLTANTDLIVKNAEYRATPSIRRYVILQQTHAGALVFAREGEDWIAETLSGDDAVLRMPEIGVEIPLAEFYLDVELVGEADDAEA